MDDIADRAACLQTGSVPALPEQARALPRPARLQRRPICWRRSAAALASTHDNKQRVEATIAAYFEFVDRDDAPFRLVFESDLTNEPAVRRARRPRSTSQCAEAIAEVIAEDTALPPEQATLLGTALAGMAQVTARYWLAGRGSIPREEAARLVAQLSWRGLGRSR